MAGETAACNPNKAAEGLGGLDKPCSSGRHGYSSGRAGCRRRSAPHAAGPRNRHNVKDLTRTSWLRWTGSSAQACLVWAAARGAVAAAVAGVPVRSPLAARLRGRGRQRALRRDGDRPHRRRRSHQDRDRPHPGVGRARRRRHRAPHAAAGARRLHQLGGVRARQHRRRADRPADRRAALPHGRLRHAAGPISACRASSPSRRRPASGRSGRTARPPTSSASRSIPARSSPTSPSCAPTGCRSSICGSPTPTRTRSTASRSTTASSSASPACWRCSSPSCSWSRAA